MFSLQLLKLTAMRSHSIKQKILVFHSISTTTLHGTRQVYTTQSKTPTSWWSHVYCITHAIFITEIYIIKTVQWAASLRALSFRQHSEAEIFLLLNSDPSKPELMQISYIHSFLNCTWNPKIRKTCSDLQINTSDQFRCIHSFLSLPWRTD